MVVVVAPRPFFTFIRARLGSVLDRSSRARARAEADEGGGLFFFLLMHEPLRQKRSGRGYG